MSNKRKVHPVAFNFVWSLTHHVLRDAERAFLQAIIDNDFSRAAEIESDLNQGSDVVNNLWGQAINEGFVGQA